MTIKETTKLKVINQAPTQPKKVDQEIITLTGITTSKVWAREKLSVTPAYCFLKAECKKCSKLDYVDLECRECNDDKEDIPVIFRIKEKQCQVIPCPECNYPKKGNWIKQTSCQTQAVKHQVEEVWIRPKIKKGSYLEIQGNFADSDKSTRPSFTAYSYSLLNQAAQIVSHE